ncbi:MAG TPA: hypothetical protein PK195_06325, partial [Ignavibacteriaceae bacterium]|nr:hypothetical protein [Ignavibacteriaceae bacterium]
MKIFNKILIIVLLVCLVKSGLAQYSWGPKLTTIRRDLYKNYSADNVYTNGLAALNTEFIIGSENIIFKRAVYQRDITDNDIPDNSTITSVTLTFSYSKAGHTFELPVAFQAVSYDIVNPDQTQLRNIWNQMNAPDIGYTTGVNNFVSFVSNNSDNPFNIAIRNALPSNKFILGIKWQNENINFFRTWFIHNYTLTLTIEFIPPQQSVTLDQRLSNNTQVGKLRKWEGTYFTPPPFINPGTSFDFPVGQPQTILGDQAVYPNGNSSEKYNNWNNDKTDVKNYHEFLINTQTNILTSKFEETRSDITIKNSLEGTTADGGQIQFRDPWLIDYPDSLYGNIKRNRGMDAQFKNRPSPFTPDYSTSYDGDVYNGVFLNQGYNPVNQTWQPPYYKVDIPEDQIISVNGQNRKFYPIGWGGSGVTIQSPGAETGIVFNSPNAVAIATLKGQLMSNSTTGISSNSQRKMVRTDNGIYHLVYESMGNVYYTHSLTSNFDGSWSQEELLRTNAKNPAIEYHVNNVKIVFEFYDPVYGDDAIIYLSAYAPNASGVYTQVVNECEEVANFPVSYFGNAKPVISYNQVQLFIAYRKNSTEGLKERTKWLNINTGLWNWSSEAAIPGTNLYSINPSVVESYAHIHLVYESQNSIMYKYAVTESY